MKHLQTRKKREQEMQGIMQRGPLRAAPCGKRTPRHMDLLEAASQTDSDSLYQRQTPRLDNRVHPEIGVGKENGPEQSQKQKPKPFNGDSSYHQIAYNQYMSSAFGLESEGELRPRNAPVERLRRPEVSLHRPDSDASAMTTDSMEVNFHMADKDYPAPSVLSAKDRRPKIHVQIPGKQPPTKRPTSTAHLATQIDRRKSKLRTKYSSQQVSPPSANGAPNNELPARLSVVSPLSVMEMPKPRRPFSAWSLEDMTKNEGRKAAARGQSSLEKPGNSDSSDDTGDTDDRSSTYTRRSSMSSLTSETTAKTLTRRHSIAFSIADPTTAGVFDPAPIVPQVFSGVRAMQSTTSLAPDTNKPLPPEPGLEEVRPLRLPNQSYSRGSDLHPRRKAPSPLNISRSSSVSTAHPNRMSSLRSKYTPADLDALDAAFVKSSPQVADFHRPREPSWEQAQTALEEHLDTIAEDESSSIVVPLACDPLQISRGPNDMVPMRQAPAPPSAAASIKLSDGSISSRNRLKKQPSKHVVMQMKSDGSEIRKRISAPVSVSGSMSKANRVLGKNEPEQPVPSNRSVQMSREASNESNWDSSDSPDTSYNGDTSSNRGDTTTPETDVSSIPDYAFEEIKARMELLSPKNDSPTLPEADKAWDHAEPFSPNRLPIQEHMNMDSRSCTSENHVTTNDQTQSSVPDVEITPMKDDLEISDKITASFEDVQDFPPARLRQRLGSVQESIRPRSLASIAASEIPDLYADLPASLEEMSAEEADRAISADAAERVLLRILEHLDNLQDLFATATVSRGFYRTFKRHELPLMKNALYGMSPAAWELREVTPPYPGLQGDGESSPLLDYTPTLYLQHYMRDMYTMIALKSMILIHCESFLRADTISALAGGETERASQIDDAFWRVWAFCQIFGCGTNREEDILAQMDWLRGGPLAKKEKRYQNPAAKFSAVFVPDVSFGFGNVDGLTAEELYDMTEIWTCMGVLVRGFHGKRQEAREYGIFDNACDLTPGNVEQEDAVLEEWTYHLLTLAPPTVLDVTSPTTPTAATFAHARSRSYTTWTPPSVSRATFLKEALSRVYQDRIAETHSNSPPVSPAAVITNPSIQEPDEQEISSEISAARWRCARHAAEIRAKRNQPGFDKLPPSEERPMSNFPSVLEKLDSGHAEADTPPVPAIPPRASRTPSSAESKSSPKKTHAKQTSTDDTSKTMVSALVVPLGPQVRDPVDVAVERLVAMGFESKKAKRALADSDTGNSINFEAALESLVRERKRDVEGLMHLGWRGTVKERRREIEQRQSQQQAGTLGKEPAVGLGIGLA
ncbi:uncharacterized protein KY384_006447 [Bacidia gigantensis]|uniref:uncharacterized protein n=1 Tax=Bacidia gigantensis TaxID=2732470 RepID=UPI001D046B51|nr:uncharacterized protein KY384_006447 [Bacidia gigantensis]KAG8528760.1 hypothetical protein KY384_006447 [Bacidia gigantensis]